MSVIFCASPNILTDKFIVFVVKLVWKWASNPRIIMFGKIKVVKR